MSQTGHANPYISSWSSFPIPNFTLSASGVLALADLQTIANRTALRGGSSWLDALVLSPGLHYQQAADNVEGTEKMSAIELRKQIVGDLSSGDVSYDVSNAAMLKYLRRLGKDGKLGDVIFDVGSQGETERARMSRMFTGWFRKRRKRRVMADSLQPPSIDWVTSILYLLSPILTAAAITFMVLLRDWWGFATIIALILSRILNILAIKNRCQPASKKQALHSTAIDDSEKNSITQYSVDIGNGRHVILRGCPADLQAVTTQTWMREKSVTDNFLEATAKLIVYTIAALSGNVTQIGSIINMALLIASAALLGLSNAHSQGFHMHGRVARRERKPNRMDSASLPTFGNGASTDHPGAPAERKPVPPAHMHGENTWPLDKKTSKRLSESETCA